MNLPTSLQAAINQWAETQGISPDALLAQAVIEKLNRLQQTYKPEQSASALADSRRLRRKNKVLILETDSDPAIDINAWIEQLREERIQEQMAL